MSAMEVLSKLTPDARSALNSRPLQTIARVDELSHGEQVTKIAQLVDRYIEPCFDRETFDLYRSSKDLCAERPDWTRQQEAKQRKRIKHVRRAWVGAKVVSKSPPEEHISIPEELTL